MQDMCQYAILPLKLAVMCTFIISCKCVYHRYVSFCLGVDNRAYSPYIHNLGVSTQALVHYV